MDNQDAIKDNLHGEKKIRCCKCAFCFLLVQSQKARCRETYRIFLDTPPALLSLSLYFICTYILYRSLSQVRNRGTRSSHKTLQDFHPSKANAGEKASEGYETARHGEQKAFSEGLFFDFVHCNRLQDGKWAHCSSANKVGRHIVCNHG